MFSGSWCFSKVAFSGWRRVGVAGFAGAFAGAFAACGFAARAGLAAAGLVAGAVVADGPGADGFDVFAGSVITRTVSRRGWVKLVWVWSGQVMVMESTEVRAPRPMISL